MDELTTHPFARTLGPGPYHFVGIGQIGVSGTFGARYTGPRCERGAGTCAHCGHAIMVVFVIETGEGRRFGVGSDCIRKVGLPVKELTAVQAAERQRQREMREARNKTNRAKWFELNLKLISQNETRLKDISHPSAYFASQGKTMLDYANFVNRPQASANALKILNQKLSEVLK